MDSFFTTLMVRVLAFLFKKMCPLILDDAFVNFDDARLEQALLLLKELAGERQVILFSCHKREAAFFAEDRAVHVVDL